jgi:hypothetical protein
MSGAQVPTAGTLESGSSSQKAVIMQQRGPVLGCKLAENGGDIAGNVEAPLRFAENAKVGLVSDI